MIPPSGRPAPRSEQEIIAELATLCVSPGYAHVIASFCFRDNIVKYSGEGLKADDYLNLHSPNRLNRPEIYESPFYWLGADKAYVSLAMKHRGEATEAFARQRLERVFGKAHVHAGVNIMASKDHAVGEIDVLVLFGNRAIVLQAKSKRLTMEARKGNDQVLKSDFQKSIQESYDQGLSCAQHLLDGKHKFIDANGVEVQLPMAVREVYIVCLISDHYPSLSFQARHFLKANTSLQIPAPFIMDVFALDAMTEMLESPLRLLSYIERRVKYADAVMAGHELTILAYHLRKNLWFDGEFNMALLGDDISVPLDIAMASRRAGVPGEKTPDGVLTRLQKTSLGRVVSNIEARPDPASIDLGFLLLTLGEETIIKVSGTIDALASGKRGHVDFSEPIVDEKPFAVDILPALSVVKKMPKRRGHLFGVDACVLELI